jgi:glycosyltransferase involved in cell wall biosynthesis
MSNKQYPLISVLIPTYNTADYVNKTISCILMQSYPNIELCIVDDGSTDGTVNILKELDSTYTGTKQINIAYSNHQGCGATRNELLLRAHGEYIFWLDSDDTISPDTLLHCYDLLQKENCDAVRIDFTTNYVGIITMDNPAYMRLLLTDRLKSYLTGTLFKRSLWEGLTFDTLSLVEDYEIYPSVASRIQKIGLIRSTGYYNYVRGREGALTTENATKVSGLVPRMKSAEKRYDIFRGSFKDESEVILSQFVNYAVILYLKTFDSKETALYAKDAKNMLTFHYDDIKKCPLIKGWRLKEVQAIVHGNKPLCYAYKAMHTAKQKTVGVRKH